MLTAEVPVALIYAVFTMVCDTDLADTVDEVLCGLGKSSGPVP